MKNLSLIPHKQNALPSKLEKKHSKRIIRIVQHGLNHPIRDMEDSDVALASIIQDLARDHGTREKIDDAVLFSCITLVKRRFSSFGIVELKEAFELAEIGTLGKVDMTAYGGVFNTGILTRVLSAYLEYRREVTKDIVKADELKLIAEDEEAKKEQFDKIFPQMIERGRIKYKSWHNVPEFWFRPALRLNLMGMVEEEEELLYWEAVHITKLSLKEKLKEEKKERNRRELRIELDELEHGVRINELLRTYRKLVVFVKLLNIDSYST